MKKNQLVVLLVAVGVVIGACSTVEEGVPSAASAQSSMESSSSVASTAMRTADALETTAAPSSTEPSVAAKGDPATVIDVLAGDRIRVNLDGTTRVITLSLIRAPKLAEREEQNDCLAPEARGYLAGIAPPNSRIQIRLMEPSTKDRPVTAIAWTPENRPLGALLAEAGFGVPVVTKNPEPQSFLIFDAQDRARAAGVGLYSAEIRCTIPGQVAAAWCDAKTSGSANGTTTTSTPDTTAPRTTTGTTATSTRSAAVADCAGHDDDDNAHLLAAALAVKKLFDGKRRGIVWAALDKDQQSLLEARVNAAVSQAMHREALAKAEASRSSEAAASRSEASRQAEESAQAAAEQAEAERIAAEEAEAERIAAEQAEAEQVAAEQAEAERIAAEQAEAERAAAESESDGGDHHGSGPVYPPDGGPPGYNGPRCWLPNAAGWRPC